MVLIELRALAPPMASAALLTRLCSLVGVAQESRNKAPKSAASACLIISSCRVGQEENTRPKGLFLQERPRQALALLYFVAVSDGVTAVNSSRLIRPSPSRSTPSQLALSASWLVSSVPVR